MVLVDSNMILDDASDDPRWSGWSSAQLHHWLDRGPVAINAIVYGEIALACETIETVDELLPPHLFDDRSMPREAAFLAARGHVACRTRGGERRPILPDVLISS